MSVEGEREGERGCGGAVNESYGNMKETETISLKAGSQYNARSCIALKHKHL